ncbi:hypothetical protein CFC21_111411 [Triticum aestivum]|uniref:Pectinesterase inhibitor domain-containing protein n=3 Tax=Triticum TaxID=4564 RepID=A0A9R1MPZ4_WHEAT|nr:hypothetical protein CFC21_084216 [Triticum aestivum]KAF7111395.1 hypothetical protein CFC21_111411 [Triticum aestivum]VAI48750.1 unnamed protein product [Triticum turgidum subsp. durum]
MKPSTARLLAAAALTAVLALASGVADATVVTTCKAAAGSDGRVDYDFCVSELGKHHDSPSADTWGLAKVAALTGVVDADNAVSDIKDLLASTARTPGRRGRWRSARSCTTAWGSPSPKHRTTSTTATTPPGRRRPGKPRPWRTSAKTPSLRPVSRRRSRSTAPTRCR